MVRVRKDVWGLGVGWNDTLLWYAKAVRELQAREVTNVTSWRFIAAMHGIIPFVWQTFGVITEEEPLPALDVQERFWAQCQHQTWYFLPWHRGYVSAFEAIVRDAVAAAGGPDDWALPYWNYSDSTQPNARQLPEVFAEATLPDGSDNPLLVTRRYGDGAVPIVVDPLDVLLTALGSDDFTSGVNDIPPGFGGPETTFHHGPESETTNGALESLPHNAIHGAIGGSLPGGDPEDWQNAGLMSMPITAALDPIFWLHHSNIDRLWNVWLSDPAHSNSAASNWLNGPADREFVMPKPDGSEWSFFPRDMLDTTAEPLGYRYEDEVAPVVENRVMRRLSRLGVRRATLDAARANVEVNMGEPGTPELIGASDGQIRVAGTTRAAVRIDQPARAKLRQSLSRVASASADSVAEPDRVFLKLEGIRGMSDAANYRVYVDLPAGADPADYSDRLAGTVSLFGVSAASDPNGPHAGSGVNQVLEITEIVDALHLSGDELNQLELQFVPANETVAAANFSVERVSVFRLGR